MGDTVIRCGDGIVYLSEIVEAYRTCPDRKMIEVGGFPKCSLLSDKSKGFCKTAHLICPPFRLMEIRAGRTIGVKE